MGEADFVASSYSLVTTQLYVSNNLGLVKIKEQNTNRFSTIKSNRVAIHQIKSVRVLPSSEMENY